MLVTAPGNSKVKKNRRAVGDAVSFWLLKARRAVAMLTPVYCLFVLFFVFVLLVTFVVIYCVLGVFVLSFC